MNKALLLDRDGVIIKEINYLHKIEDVEFVDGIFEACRFFQAKRFLIFIVTNQAGIGRGYYTEQQFLALTNWMVEQFASRDVKISQVYHCPHHPTMGLGNFKRACPDRKPNPGMILRAQREFNLNLAESVLVGDKESDIEAGLNAGVGLNVLVRSGHPIGNVTKANLIIDSIKQLPEVLGVE